MTRLAATLLLTLMFPAAAQDLALPDPTMTPGAIDPGVTLSDICNGTTRTRRRPVTALCSQALAAYGIGPEHRYEYECDHLVPLSLAGANAIANLWPQPAAEAARKDRLEVAMQQAACRGYRTLAPTDATAVLRQEQQDIADDWTAAERRYGDAHR